MAAIIQFRRDTAANWTSNNPTLAIGEIGYETDNENYKIGDGSTAWTSLDYGGLGDIHKTLIDAKGDLVVGTADNTAGILAVGSDGQHLVADSSAAGGVSWEANTESVEDVVGAQLATNGSHTGITATYDDAGDGAIDLALVTENVQDITGAQIATNGSHTGITATYDDAGDGAVDLALITENVQDIVAGQLVTNGTHSGITATYDDAGDGAIDLNVDDFSITLAGDLSGSTTITNLADVTLTATIVADATELGTDTTGNYVASLVAGTGVTLTNNSGETATPTVAIGQAVGASDTPTFGSVTISSAVANATHAATKAYVDNAIAGLDWHEAVNYASAAVLPNTPTYDNGTAGVGATLTTSTQVRLVIDGANATTGNRVLVQDQATAAHNGIYDVTAQGVSGSAVWVLTRATDFDGAPTGEIKAGEAVYVLAGSANGGQGFVVTSTSDPHTVGTHDVDFTQFTGTQAFVAGTGVSITGNTINVGTAGAARIVVNADDIDLATTAVTAAAYGSATAVPGYTVDAYGRLTAAADTTIAIPSTAVTDFTEAVQDVAGAQVATNGSHTGIAATYDDAGDGAIDLTLTASGASAASYGSATQVPGYTVDTYGRLTAASNTTIAIPSTAVTDFTEATQDVAGAQVATNGSHTGIAATYDDAGDGAIDLTLTVSGVSAAAYGSATQVPGYTVDTYGRLTAAANTTIAIPSTAVTDFTEATQDVSGAQLATNGTHTGITAAYDDAGDGAIDLALVTENVQDITGAQIATNGSHTGITATYDDAGDGAIDLALVTENVQDISGAQLATNGSHTGITATYDDAGDGAIDLALVTENVQDITGAQLATNGSHTGITATYDDAGDGAVDLALITENVQDIVGGQLVTNGTHTGIAATYDDAGDGAIDLNVDDFTITLGGDLTGNVTITDLASATLTATIAADSVALGTDSTGNYVATVAGTANEVDVSGSGSETAAVTIGLPAAVTVTTSLTTPLVNVSGASIVIEGATANDFETTLTVTDPTADRTITFLDETGTVFTTASVQALADGVTGTTQSASDASTKLATTAYVDTGLGALSSDSITDADGDTKIQVEESADEDIIRFDTAGVERMSIGATGTVTIVGDLTVNGTQTTISSTTITVDDKNIEIGSVTTPTDLTADGGGLTLKGATDKTWNWVNATDAWTSSEHVDLASGKAFYVAGVSVLNATTLGSNVVASSLTSVGTIASLAATDLTVSGIATFSGTIAGASPLVFEGATADDYETTFAITDPTADRTITFQDATGTVAYLASPTFTGTPAAPTAAADTNTTQIATTAFVMTEIGDYLTTSTAGSTYAPIASPTLTGVPAAPTAAADTNTTQLATTAFVMTEVGDYLLTATASSTYAPLASPTLTGVPAAPTAAADTNTTQIATTAYVQTELGALSSDSISDADSDTKIQVEESADEDKIRFDIAGTEVAVLDGTALDIAGNILYDIDINAQTGTAYTLVAGDRGKLVTMYNASASTCTVPPNSSVAFPIGTQIQVVQWGDGELTMVAGSGVTLSRTPGLKLRDRFSSVTCIKMATNEWLLVGDLEA